MFRNKRSAMSVPGFAALAMTIGLALVIGASSAPALAVETVTSSQTVTAVTSVKTVKVPKVVGKSGSKAKKALTSAGFKTKFVAPKGSSVWIAANWKVKSQSPKAGTKAKLGTVVKLKVVKRVAPAVTSTPVMTLVPDASTLAPTLMQTALAADGYVVALVDISGSPVADPTGWTFVSESPTAGTPVAVGTIVTIILAPPPPAPVIAPPAPAPGGGATALCRDGSLSYSAHRQGTCSHHGGVAQWY